MSWLFGLRKDPVPDLSSLGGNLNLGSGSSGGEGQPPSSGGSSSDSGGSGDKKSMEAYRFDSSALERAAKAAKELESSKNSKEILELTKMQEINKQLEQQTKIKEFEAHIENSKSEQIRVQQEERRKTIAEETKHNQMRAQYQDQLARKRYEDQLLQQQRANDENLRKQEESLAKQEAMRRATLEKEMEIRHQSDMKRIEAEIRAKGKVERDNQDLYLEQIRLKATENRTTVLESMKTAGSILGTGFTAFINNWSAITASVAGISMLYLSYYTVKRGTGVAARFIESRLGKPTLIRETSRLTLTEALKHPIKTQRRLMKKPTDVLRGVILNPTLEERLSKITIATRNTRKNKGYYRNILLYGPPGTGKTLFVKRLAEHCGMNYGIMSGGDVIAMHKEGVTAINKVFDWARTSNRGLLLFLDEAEAFLRKRSSADNFGENALAALNAFLFRTGEPSDRFMLVLASNTPEMLDWAMNDRLDEIIEFKLPGLPERERMIRLYFDKFVLIPATETKKFKVGNFNYGKVCSDIAAMTEGLSGREIFKLATAWQFAAYTSDDGVLTEELTMNEVYLTLKQHAQKASWFTAEEARKQILDVPVPRTIPLQYPKTAAS